MTAVGLANSTQVAAVDAKVGEVFETPADFWASTSTDFTVGQIVRTRDLRGLYEIVASSGHKTTAGGVEANVLVGDDGKIHSDAFGTIGPGDSTADLTAAVAAAENGTLVIDRPVLGSFICDRLIPADNTTIEIQPGTTFNVIANGSRAFQIQKENVHIWGYGAKVVMDGTQTSHGVFFTAGGTNIAKNCSVRGLHVIGSGNAGDDCFYVGGDVTNDIIPENIKIIDVKGEGIGAGTRNALSIVAVNGCLVEDSEFWNALGAPGAAIDIEANRYMTDGSSAIKNTIVRRNKCHSSKLGIAIVFGAECIIEDNECYNNTSNGIGSAAGGTQFNFGVYREGDVLGVSAINTSNGEITVSTGSNLADDLGFRVGTVVAPLTRNSGAFPAEVTQTFYVVNEISADQSKFKIGPYFRYGTLESFSDAGTGTLSNDPEVSDLYFQAYLTGNNSDITVRRNKCYGNGAAAEIKLAQGLRYRVHENVITASGNGLIISYIDDFRAYDNECEGGTGTGLSIAACARVKTRSNEVVGFAAQGMAVTGCASATCDADTIINCATPTGRAFRAQFGTGARLSPIIFNDSLNPSPNGLIAENTVTNSLIVGARCESAGADNATSIQANGAGNRIIDSVQNDGTFRANTA